MRPLSTTLSNLIVEAETVITRPRSGALRMSAETAAEVRAADARPAEGIRTTRAALVMVIALEEIRHAEPDAAAPWLMIAGALLPMLRAEAYQAFCNEREQGK